jgi:hypothetical protein
MIVIMLVLVVGMFLGAVLADHAFQPGAAAARRRALERLEDMLGGLDAAYAVKAAQLDAQRESDGKSGLAGDGAGDLDARILHLPQRHTP